MTVAELAPAAKFYADALGAEIGPERALTDPAWNRLLGLDEDSKAKGVDVTFGEQTIRLVAFEPQGWSYPKPRASNEQWFEHVALVAEDITAAWERLAKFSPEEITKGAPVLLPENTGGVTAFKFRDRCGHPLELISFPQGVGDPMWQTKTGKGIAGYDHTAIVVTDVERSVAFYTELLGLEVEGRSLNQGPEQDLLDGLVGCEVDVVALKPPVRKTPHLELLHYRMPTGRTSSEPVPANDVASTRQVYAVEGLEDLVEKLKTEGTSFVDPDIVTLKSGRAAAAIRDPDGHMIVLLG